MAYVYTLPSKAAPRARLATTARNLPVRVVPAPRLVAARPVAPRGRVVRVRYDTTGTDLGSYVGLGILPAIAAAALPSVKDLAQKALNSVIGIVDPGKKRDANRQARAALWCGLANRGSITAARRVLGGSTLQYTPKERQYYLDCWTALQKSKPMLAQQAQTLGGLGVPEPGSDIAPPLIPDEDMAALQREVDAYDAATAAGATQLPAPATAKALPAAGQSSASLGPLVGLAIAGAVLRKVF